MKVKVKKVALRKSLHDTYIDRWLKMGDDVARVDKTLYYDGLMDYEYIKVKDKGGNIGFVRRDSVG